MSGYLLLGTSTGAVVALVIWFVVVPIGLRGVFEALGVPRSRAWVPFVNIATVYRLGGFSEFWLIVLVIPPATVLGMIMLFIASHRVTRLLGRSGWFTVLAVVMWWAWALAIGLPHGAARSSNSEPVIWSVRRPEAALRLPSADDATPSASSPLIEPIIVRPPRLDTPLQRPLADAGPAPVPSPPPPPPSFAPQPTVPLPRLDAGPFETAPAPVLPQFEPEEDATVLTRGVADQTVISARRRPQWSVRTAMGHRIELVGTSAILGRRPRAHPLYPGAQLVMVTDDATSVSAIHAVLEYVEDEWHVTDLGSTNGVWLVDPVTGEEQELRAHERQRVTPRFLLGELDVQVVRSV